MQGFEIGSIRIVELDALGPLLASEESALDIIGESYGMEADIIAIPVSRLSAEFLDLSTRVLRLAVQKFTNHQMRIAFLGDISDRLAGSKALRDFVLETNKQRRIVFAKDKEELAALLS